MRRGSPRARRAPARLRPGLHLSAAAALPRPRPLGAHWASGRCAPHFAPSSGSLLRPQNLKCGSREEGAVFKWWAQEDLGSSHTRVPGRGGRRPLPPAPQRTWSLPPPRAPRIQRADPSAPTPTGEGHQRRAGAQLSWGRQLAAGGKGGAPGRRRGPAVAAPGAKPGPVDLPASGTRGALGGL